MTYTILPAFLLFQLPSVEFPGGSQLVLMLLRWIHITAGIVWVGLLYYFNLVNIPFLQELDAQNPGSGYPQSHAESSVVVPLELRRDGASRRRLVDAHRRDRCPHAPLPTVRPASSGMISASFFLIWTLAFAIEMGVLMSPAEVLKKGPVLGVIVAIVVFAASYLFLSLNQQDWESARTLSIGIGGGLGWFMMLNVWGIIWRMQKKIIRWNLAAVEG